MAAAYASAAKSSAEALAKRDRRSRTPMFHPLGKSADETKGCACGGGCPRCEAPSGEAPTLSVAPAPTPGGGAGAAPPPAPLTIGPDAPLEGAPAVPAPQPRERGSGLDDPLYMADRRWSSGQGPDDRVTGRRLQNWAIARGSFVVRDDRSLMRMQEKDGAASDIVEEILVLLTDLLWGRSAFDPLSSENVVIGDPRARLSYESTRLDFFEGSDNARGAAVLELADHWGPIATFLEHQLERRYRDAYFEALGRTPRDMSLVDDPETIRELRTNPDRHVHRIDQGFLGEVEFRPGQSYGSLRIVGIHKFLGSGSTGGGVFWAAAGGRPLWYYSGSVDLLNRQAVIGQVASAVAEQAQFAGALWPLMIKVGGLALSFSPTPAAMIAGVVLEQLGEEGLRDLNGQGRSFKEIASDSAKEMLINLVFAKLGGGGKSGGGKSGAASEGAQALERVAEKAAARIRTTVEAEIVRTEGPKVARAIESGELREVTDAALRKEGFVREVKVEQAGGAHTYRRKAGGRWCRWSVRICDIDMPGADAAVREADTAETIFEQTVREREGMIAPRQRAGDEIGMRETAKPGGKAPTESGVKGTMGETGHAGEVVGAVPRPATRQFSPDFIAAERERLLRGDITLREFVEKYPDEGAAQVFFPSLRGGGRYVDHVYLDRQTMFVVFRESKNVRAFTLGEREIAQLNKDLGYLSHARFQGLRIEWRITGVVDEATIAQLKSIRRKFGNFDFSIGPIRAP
jgi:hypothetical protein